MGSAVVAMTALLLFSGCATPSLPSRVKEPIGFDWTAQRVHIGTQTYLPLDAVATQLRGRQEWDPKSQVWMLTALGHELRLAPHMSVALVDGVPYALSATPILDPNGRLLLPEGLWHDRLFQWRTPERIPPPVPSVRLKTIVVDAGHGGHDPGALGPTGLKEKTVALAIARFLRDMLIKDGFRVVMTRYDDRFIPLEERSAIANREGGDLFVSIHANASRRRSASGFEVYYLSEATDDHARALEAAENASLPGWVAPWQAPVPKDVQTIVWDLIYTEHRAESRRLGEEICWAAAQLGLPWRSRGVKSARFWVLKGSRMPAVLVEVGFITSYDGERHLSNPEIQRRLAQIVRQGILRYRDRLDRDYAYLR